MPAPPAGGVAFTIGHSTHTTEQFVALLRGAGIGQVADVRAFPASRHNPQFNRDPLHAALDHRGIGYEHLPELGGRREPGLRSPNGGWGVEALRGYADHMGTPEFEAGMDRLTDMAREAPTAAMCAEADWSHCHRRLIADALAVRGWGVVHVLADGRTVEHELTPFAAVEDGAITYPPAQGSLL